MIDLHSHLIPGIDDGARTTEQSLRVLARFAADGVTGVVCTPHLSASQVSHGIAETLIEERDRKLGALRTVADDGPALHPGFEILLDEPLPATAMGDRRLSLAGSRYYLVEFPLAVVGGFGDQVLYRMAQAGIVPVVAHPERYADCSPRLVARWREVGARIQVDATTITRASERGHRARQLLAAGLADVLAADNHGDGRSLASAAAFVREKAEDAHEAIDLLTRRNPSAVVEDRDLAEVPPVRIDEGMLGRARRFLRGLRDA